LHSWQNQPIAWRDAEPGNRHSERYINTRQYSQRGRGRVGGFAILSADYPSLKTLRIHTPCYMSEVFGGGSMTFLNSVMGGFGVAAGVVTVLAISNGLSTYIFDGQTITQKVDARLGSGGSV